MVRPQQRLGRRSLAAVVILQPHDVVFAQVGPRLHLDDMEWDLPGVLDPMLDPDGDIGRLIFLEQENLVPSRDARGPRDDDPMLRPVMMQLQRQYGAGL